MVQLHLLTGWRSREPGRAQKCRHRPGNNFGSIAAIAPLLPQSSGVGVALNWIMLKSRECAGEQGEFRRPTANVSLLRRSKQFAFEKVLFGRPTKFSRTTDASRAWRREGPHWFAQERPPTIVSALQTVAAVAASWTQLSQDFSAQSGWLPKHQRQPSSAKFGTALVTGTKRDR